MATVALGNYSRVIFCRNLEEAEPIRLLFASAPNLAGKCNEPKAGSCQCTLTFFKQLLFLLRTLYHIIELFGLLKFSVVLHCQLYLKHVASNIPRVFF